jgi:antitoxin ParD1/3/4
VTSFVTRYLSVRQKKCGLPIHDGFPRDATRIHFASEVIRARLRLLEDYEKLQALKLAELKAAIQAGIDSGPGVPAEAVFDRLEQKYAAKAKGRSA